MDDIGASTKRYEVYSKKPYGNLLFLKYLPYFSAWGIYSEISAGKWLQIFDILEKYNAKITLGVTASWVEKNGSLTPFPEKFPEQSSLIKQAVEKGLVEVANHGLTHCVVGKHLPILNKSNRKYHREFWDWIPYETQFEHLKESQKIFKDWLGHSPRVLIPPGNVFSSSTYEACSQVGIELINSYFPPPKDLGEVSVVNPDSVIDFHDREIQKYGVCWLEKLLAKHPNVEYGFLSSFIN